MGPSVASPSVRLRLELDDLVEAGLFMAMGSLVFAASSETLCFPLVRSGIG